MAGSRPGAVGRSISSPSAAARRIPSVPVSEMLRRDASRRPAASSINNSASVSDCASAMALRSAASRFDNAGSSLNGTDRTSIQSVQALSTRCRGSRGGVLRRKATVAHTAAVSTLDRTPESREDGGRFGDAAVSRPPLPRSRGMVRNMSGARPIGKRRSGLRHGHVVDRHRLRQAADRPVHRDVKHQEHRCRRD